MLTSSRANALRAATQSRASTRPSSVIEPRSSSAGGLNRSTRAAGAATPDTKNRTGVSVTNPMFLGTEHHDDIVAARASRHPRGAAHRSSSFEFDEGDNMDACFVVDMNDPLMLKETTL